jgi:hypothetical protein
MKRLILSAGFLMTVGSCLYGQGDGPRSYLLAPKGVTGVSAKWLNLSQNLIPAGTALIPKADIKVDVFPTTLFHTFSLGGRIAQAYFMFNPGSATAGTSIGPPIGPIPTNELEASGFSDGMIGFKMGLYGAPALNIIEFAKSPMQFSVFGDLRLWYSGSYDAGKLFNLGTNRNIIQIAVPMAIPLNKNRARATWLEVSPSVMFFTANDEPSRNPLRPGTIDKVSQTPLLILENHLTHNFTPKFWAGANLRFQYGGESKADGVSDDNPISVVGGGLVVGYQILPILSAYADYGGVLISDQAKGEMFRLSVTLTYASMKKAKAELEAKKALNN